MTLMMPTHTCFDDALDLLGELVKANPELAHTNEVYLVHAICTAPDGHDFAHAWLETTEGRALFDGIVDGVKSHFAANAAEYRKDLKAKEVIVYTPREAWEENKRSGHFGPWLDRMRTLCAAPGSLRKVWTQKT